MTCRGRCTLCKKRQTQQKSNEKFGLLYETDRHCHIPLADALQKETDTTCKTVHNIDQKELGSCADNANSSKHQQETEQVDVASRTIS